MNKFIRAIEIIVVSIITDYFFLLSALSIGFAFEFFFCLHLILLPFLCSVLFYMVIQSPSSKEKVAFNLFRLILLFAVDSFFAKRLLGNFDENLFLDSVLAVIFLDAVFSVLIFYLTGRWMKRKQVSVSMSTRGKSVVVGLLTCFMIITIPILLNNFWHYFDGSCTGTYVGRFSNDKVALDRHYFCYNDVVEADFKIRAKDNVIVLNIDSIRIKENSSDLYSDSQKEQMLEKIISLAENDGMHMGGGLHDILFDSGTEPPDYTLLEKTSRSAEASDDSDRSWSGTYVSNDTGYQLVLDQHYFCYNDVVEADFKLRDRAIVLDIDSIRIKENSPDIYTDSQKQQMLDEIIFLAENNGIRLAVSDREDCIYLYRNDWHFYVFEAANDF